MDRPRRLRRPATKARSPSPPPVVSLRQSKKRKTQGDLADPETFLSFVLKNPKSPLTTTDISDLVNATNWNLLSPGSQDALKTLLPHTAFAHFTPTIDASHPLHLCSSGSDAMAVDIFNMASSSPVDSSVFTDPHFLAAAHTLQDHIYSDWMSDSHSEKVKEYENAIRDGTLSAPWKDDVWERNNPCTIQETSRNGTAYIQSGVPVSSARAGAAAEIRLCTLVKNNVFRIGDIIAYKRSFTTVDLIIEKDAIIQSIHPKTNALTVLFSSGMSRSLPHSLVLTSVTELGCSTPSEQEDPSMRVLAATILTPSMLETAILDSDARVEKTRRPNGNAWKCFTIYRWRGDEAGNLDDPRGGRENHGTLFYLRGTYYHENI